MRRGPRSEGSLGPGPDRSIRPREQGGPASVGARIESIGVALPERRATSREVVDSCRHAPRIHLERLTGIRERRVCGEGEDSHSLAVDAARRCLARSRHGAQDVEMVICSSITKFVGGLSYRFEPALSLSITESLGVKNAIHFDVSNACAGMLTGIALLDSFIRSGTLRCGMVVSGEYVSSISDNAAQVIRSTGSRQLASLTVGDAGAAVIVDRAAPEAGEILACEFSTFAEHGRLCIGRPSSKRPGARMITDAQRIHQAAIAICAPTVRAALVASRLRMDEIDFLIPHQTSIRAIRSGRRSLEAELGSMARVVVENLETLGNTASTSHFLALERLIGEGALRSKDRIMLLAFASGIVIGSLVFTVGELGGVRGHGD
ncbi:MAG: 3-oxoacyl-ACP synthase III family protein [Myxococcota bacterium]